jgi:hypothetical protein
MVQQLSLEVHQVVRQRSARCVRKRQRTTARETFVRSAVDQTDAMDHSIAVMVELVSLKVRKEEMKVRKQKMCRCVATECSFVGKASVTPLSAQIVANRSMWATSDFI